MVQGPVAGLRAALRRLPLVALLVLATFTLAMASVLVCRYQQKRMDTGADPAPAFESVLASSEVYASELPRTGRFEAQIAYSVLDGGDVSTSVTWDDAWFSQDEAVYNHELARVASVISALAYAESNHYQESYSAPAYMEDALAKLGFSEVSTESYRYRSEVVDQVLNVFTQDEDTVAYTIARKALVASDGAERDLILVAVRGSYGSEWLSNLDFMVGGSASSAAEAIVDAARAGIAPEREDIEAAEAEAVERADHPGYTVAAQEVCRALEPWIADSHERGREVSLVLVGHSRGGAVANLAAALELDVRAAAQEGVQITDVESAAMLGAGDVVCAYTFAAPRVTVRADAHDARYASVFNIIHPADLMPSLPLGAWGYERYGQDLMLPAQGDDGFEGRYARMQEAFVEVMGCESTFDPGQVEAIASLVESVRRAVPTAADLATPAGVTSVLGACAASINPVTVLEGHYPSVYIAWMQALTGAELVRG